jgi:hypothetical protein
MIMCQVRIKNEVVMGRRLGARLELNARPKFSELPHSKT